MTHKPFTLEIATRSQSGATAKYTIPTKVSERKIKRRENACSTVSRVWLDAGSGSSSAGGGGGGGGSGSDQSLSLCADTRGSEAAGFLIYVETKGGQTTGRQKQRYVLLKRNALYTLSAPSGVVNAPSDVMSVTLRSYVGDVLPLAHWHPSQPAPPISNASPEITPAVAVKPPKPAAYSAPTHINSSAAGAAATATATTTLSTANKPGRLLSLKVDLSGQANPTTSSFAHALAAANAAAAKSSAAAAGITGPLSPLPPFYGKSKPFGAYQPPQELNSFGSSFPTVPFDFTAHPQQFLSIPTAAPVPVSMPPLPPLPTAAPSNAFLSFDVSEAELSLSHAHASSANASAFPGANTHGMSSHNVSELLATPNTLAGFGISGSAPTPHQQIAAPVLATPFSTTSGSSLSSATTSVASMDHDSELNGFNLRQSSSLAGNTDDSAFEYFDDDETAATASVTTATTPDWFASEPTTDWGHAVVHAKPPTASPAVAPAPAPAPVSAFGAVITHSNNSRPINVMASPIVPVPAPAPVPAPSIVRAAASVASPQPFGGFGMIKKEKEKAGGDNMLIADSKYQRRNSAGFMESKVKPTGSSQMSDSDCEDDSPLGTPSPSQSPRSPFHSHNHYHNSGSASPVKAPAIVSSPYHSHLLSKPNGPAPVLSAFHGMSNGNGSGFVQPAASPNQRPLITPHSPFFIPRS